MFKFTSEGVGGIKSWQLTIIILIYTSAAIAADYNAFLIEKYESGLSTYLATTTIYFYGHLLYSYVKNLLKHSISFKLVFLTDNLSSYKKKFR